MPQTCNQVIIWKYKQQLQCQKKLKLTRPKRGLWALYEFRTGNGLGLFYSFQSLHSSHATSLLCSNPFSFIKQTFHPTISFVLLLILLIKIRGNSIKWVLHIVWDATFNRAHISLISSVRSLTDRETDILSFILVEELHIMSCHVMS